MKAKVLDLDKRRALHPIITRELGTDEYVIAANVGEDKVLTYIPDSLTDVDLVYLIKCLEDRRRNMFGDD